MEGAVCGLNIINKMVGRLIIHFHGTSIQSVQNWKLVVLNWLTCSIWRCQENQWDTHEYSPVYIVIFKVRQSSIFIVRSYRENGWIFNTWEHLGIIKCTWPSKFWSYILALTQNRKSIFLIRYIGMFERLSLERSLEPEGGEQLLNRKSYSMPLCLPRSSRQLKEHCFWRFLGFTDGQPNVRNGQFPTLGRTCFSGLWMPTC